MKRSFATLAVALAIAANGALPTEIRLFVSGWNETENGNYLFDEEAARLTMAAAERWGVDVMIDLEHQALHPVPVADPTARDARGWCRLELRADGSLWATDVRWTADGAARLSEKRQRYVSPAFKVDPETKRITQIINVAITSIPATHHTPALVAAAARGSMDAAQVKQALDAFKAGDGDKCMALLEEMIAAAAAAGSGDPDATTEDAPPPAGDGGADEETENAAEPPPPAEDPAKKKDEGGDAMAAAARVAMTLTGLPDPGAAMTELARRSAIAVEVEQREQKLAADRAALEVTERRTLVGSLVKLGAEIPATAWSDEKGTVPCDRLQKEPIAELRARVAKLTAAKPGGSKSPVTPPPGTPSTTELTPRELELCARKKIDPAKYAETRAGIRARNPRPNAQGA